jgi:hypothetical protein
MITSVKVIADSQNWLSDDRLITLELTFPRIIQSQLNTYRKSSKNSASSRAKSMKTMRFDALNNYFQPTLFQGDNKGMYSTTELSPLRQKLAALVWNSARLTAVFHHKLFSLVGVHKEISNRVIEPYLYSTASHSSWQWLIQQRIKPDAQPQFRELAIKIKFNIEQSTPKRLQVGEYHLPYITLTDKGTHTRDELVKLSVARCAAVSYKTFDGKLGNEAALRIYEKLKESKHLTPFEHVATPTTLYHQNCYNAGWHTERNLLEDS